MRNNELLYIKDIKDWASRLKVLNPMAIAKMKDMREKVVTEFSDMSLDDASHIYTSEKYPTKEWCSVTTILKRFVPEADWDKIAEAYAAKNNKKKEDVRQEWDDRGTVACTLGTKAHLLGETICNYAIALLLGEDEVTAFNILKGNIGNQLTQKGDIIVPLNNMETGVIQFWNETFFFNSNITYIPISAEQIIRNEAQGYAGTIDLLLMNIYSDKLAIFDYKTNSSLDNSYNRKQKIMLNAPFGFMVNENISEYTIQLGYYAKALAAIAPDIEETQLVHVGKKKGDVYFDFVELASTSIVKLLD